MTYILRPLTPHDYPALAEFYCAAGQPTTADSIRYNDETREAYCHYGRFLAEADGRIVGTGRYRQNPGAYHAQRFDVKVLVLPAYRHQSIGTALYGALLQALAPLGATTLTANVRESEPAGLRFARQLGFVETMRQWESRLDLTTADLERFAPALDRVAKAGYELISFADLAGDPSANRAVYQLLNEVRRDVPTPEPMTDIPWERWERAQTGPKFWPAGFFVARKGTELIGLSQLWKSDEPGLISTGLTAVRRAHRGRGIATALKIQALRVAQAAGYSTVSTLNETNNREMLAVNEKLGFIRQPAWISLRLELTPQG